MKFPHIPAVLLDSTDPTQNLTTVIHGHSAYSILTQRVPYLGHGFVERWPSSRIAMSETIHKKFGGLLDHCHILRSKINDLRRVQGIRLRVHA